MQGLIAYLGVTLPKLDPNVREQAGGGHEDLRGSGTWARDYACRSGYATAALHRDTIAQVVRKANLEPDNNEIYAAYTLIRENLHTNDSGRTR
jgi:Ubiquitin associated domain (UBA)